MDMKPNEFFSFLMDRNRDNPNSLSKKIGVPQPTLARFASGTARAPQTKTLIPIAKHYKVPVESLLNERSADAAYAEIMNSTLVPVIIGAVARPQKIEANTSAGPGMYAPVPLISWVQAGEWCGIVDNFAPGDADEWLPVPRAHGPNAYALRVRGISMEPRYKDGSIIFVDPSKQADHGSNVVVRMDDEAEATFKQLVIEGDNKFLRALNPDWPGPKLIEIKSNATICGVVIGQFIPD